MARPEVTGRKPGSTKTTPTETRATGPPIVELPRAAYTIAEFCEAHRISQSFYFKIRGLGLGPRECRTLNKITITGESAADWRRANETAETARQPTARSDSAA
jgi:hypothetical protein